MDTEPPSGSDAPTANVKDWPTLSAWKPIWLEKTGSLFSATLTNRVVTMLAPLASGRQTDHEDSGSCVCVGGQAAVVIWRTIAIVPAKREGSRTTARRRSEGHRLTGRWSSRAGGEVDSRCYGDADR